MKLVEALGVSRLQDEGRKRPLIKESKTAEELAAEVFVEAEMRGEPFLHHTPKSWAKKWLPSKQFRLMMLPLNAAASPCPPRGENLVLKKIHAREDKPIIVDFNRNKVGRTHNGGFVPEVIVIDGKHRFRAAMLRGESHIPAWVGVQAVSSMSAATQEGFRMAARRCGCGGKCGCKKMEAVGGGGGGPDPGSTTGAPGASLVAKKMKSMKRTRDLLAEYSHDVRRGKFQASIMKASVPTGYDGMVTELTAVGVANPTAIAWWHRNKYGSSIGKEK